MGAAPDQPEPLPGRIDAPFPLRDEAGGDAVGTGKRGPTRSTDIDRQVGSRIRERRILLGITQQQLADLIGVTYQQAHKYETGANRVAVGRLFTIAEALNVSIGYFFPSAGQPAFEPTQEQQRLLDFVRTILAIPDPRQQQIIGELARLLANSEQAAARAEQAAAPPAA